MNNLEYACKKLGYQGGTIHQLAKELDIDATDLLVMSQDKLGELIEERLGVSETTYTLYYDCNNCGNSYREGEVEDSDPRCTCGTGLVSNEVEDK